MAIRSSRCAVCGQQAYRNRYGQMLRHTVRIIGDRIGDKGHIEVCAGSDRGARP